MATNEKNEKGQSATLSRADRVAAALAKASAYLDGNQVMKGAVLGLSESCTPYWFVPGEIGAATAEALRRDLEARGFEHNPSATVSQVHAAEVWETPNEVATVLADRRDQINGATMRVARQDVQVRA